MILEAVLIKSKRKTPKADNTKTIPEAVLIHKPLPASESLPAEIKLMLLESSLAASPETAAALGATSKDFRSVYLGYEQKVLLETAKQRTGLFYDMALFLAFANDDTDDTGDRGWGGKAMRKRELHPKVLLKGFEEAKSAGPSLNMLKYAIEMHKKAMYFAALASGHMNGPYQAVAYYQRDYINYLLGAYKYCLLQSGLENKTINRHFITDSKMNTVNSKNKSSRESKHLEDKIMEAFRRGKAQTFGDETNAQFLLLAASQGVIGRREDQLRKAEALYIRLHGEVSVDTDYWAPASSRSDFVKNVGIRMAYTVAKDYYDNCYTYDTNEFEWVWEESFEKLTVFKRWIKDTFVKLLRHMQGVDLDSDVGRYRFKGFFKDLYVREFAYYKSKA